MADKQIVSVLFEGDDLLVDYSDGSSTKYFNCYPVNNSEVEESPKTLTLTFSYNFGLSGRG